MYCPGNNRCKRIPQCRRRSHRQLAGPLAVPVARKWASAAPGEPIRIRWRRGSAGRWRARYLPQPDRSASDRSSPVPLAVLPSDQRDEQFPFATAGSSDPSIPMPALLIRRQKIYGHRSSITREIPMSRYEQHARNVPHKQPRAVIRGRYSEGLSPVEEGI